MLTGVIFSDVWPRFSRSMIPLPRSAEASAWPAGPWISMCTLQIRRPHRRGVLLQMQAVVRPVPQAEV